MSEQEKKDRCKYCKHFKGSSGYYECGRDSHRIDRFETCRWEGKDVWEEKRVIK